MTTSRAQHVSSLTPCAPVHGLAPHPAPPRRLSHAAQGAALLGVWVGTWIFLAAAVAAPAGRMHAASVHPDRDRPAASARAAFASVVPGIADKP